MPGPAALARGEGRDHVDAFAAFSGRSAAGFCPSSRAKPKDDGDPIRGRLGRRRGACDATTLECRRGEGGENIAGVIPRGRAAGKRPEPAQEFELPFAGPGDL
ncbi:MAG: hypothetical protein M3Z96_10555, partial [Pseudomonadota bacterium]|nr:hypothetical protein [Pseudomonadota bacterium]